MKTFWRVTLVGGPKRSKPQRQQGPKRAEGRICWAHLGRWQESSKGGLEKTDSPHLFIQIFPVSLVPPSTPFTHSFHLCPSVSLPFTSFPHLSPTCSFASFCCCPLWCVLMIGVPHFLFTTLLFFCCIAELAIKPCRSSRSNCAENSGFQTLAKQETNTTKQQNTPKPKTQHNTKTGKCLECETRGEKRVKRPKRPNALICRTPGGSMRYPLSSSLGMMLISHSIVSIPASPSRFAI